MFCIKRSFCKILYTIIQRFGKCFNKRSTTGRTSFIQLYTVNRLVLDLDTFHILTTNIQNTVNFRIKECCCIIMRNRLNFSLIQKKSCFDQRFSITGRTCICDSGSFRKFGINFLNRTDRSFQRTSVIITIERIQKTSIFTYQCSFGRCRSCINSKITVPFIGCEIACRNFIRRLTFIKLLIVLSCCKQRLHTLYFKIHLDGMTKSVFQFCQRDCNIFFCIQCRTDCCKQVRILRYDRMLLIQFQSTDKRFL